MVCRTDQLRLLGHPSDKHLPSYLIPPFHASFPPLVYAQIHPHRSPNGRDCKFVVSGEALPVFGVLLSSLPHSYNHRRGKCGPDRVPNRYNQVMAVSFSMVWSMLACFCVFATLCSADTVTFHWNITWVTVNPDLALERPAIGINGQWPPPPVAISRGDRLIVDVHNQLGNQSTSIHFHGIYQNGQSCEMTRLLSTIQSEAVYSRQLTRIDRYGRCYCHYAMWHCARIVIHV